MTTSQITRTTTRATSATPMRNARPDPDRASATAAWHDLARQLAAPITDAARRDRVDRALELLLGPGGANAAHLRPVAATPDVVRHRIAGWALAHLDPADHPRHTRIVRQASALLRA